jgi:ABC-type nickel/cobalt efflux system permease component RcnA
VTVVLLLLAGLAAGSIHVVSGADHLAAVAPLAAASRRRAWRTGAGWGLGHAGGVAVVAVAAFALRSTVPLESLSSWSERLVGLTLIGIGVWALGRAFRIARGRGGSGLDHEHLHAPGDEHGHEHVHAHLHIHDGIVHAHEHRHGRARAASLVGLLHGTAGAGHVLGVLPALALPTHATALGYLIGFGLGTIVAMTIFAAFVGAAGRRLAGLGSRAWGGLLGGCAATSIAVGIFWLMP